MNFEQFFENKIHYGNRHGNYSYDNPGYSYPPNQDYDKYYRQKAILKNVLNNGKLRTVIIIAVVAVIIVFIALVALLFPLLKNFINFILENGISGLAGEASKMLEKIWNGSR